MTGIYIFWSSVFSIVSFSIGTFVKAIASFVTAFVSAATLVIKIIFLAGVTMLVLFLVYKVSIGTLTVGAILSTIVKILVVLAILFGVFGGIGQTIIMIIFGLICMVEDGLKWLFYRIAEMFENGNAKSLQVITDKLEKK